MEKRTIFSLSIKWRSVDRWGI